MAATKPADVMPAGLWPDLEPANYAVVTPYLLPADSPKTANHGDGFILDACVRLIGRRPVALFSARAELSREMVHAWSSMNAIVLAGANSLRDDFAPCPGFDRAALEDIRVPIIPFGIGHYGVESVTRGLSPAAAALLAEMHRRIAFSSVRCDASRRYLAGTPFAGQVLMTLCPVVHSPDRSHRGFTRKSTYDHAVVTVTDRIQLDAQLPILGLARTLFRARRWTLALHQDHQNARLEDHAKRLGFDVFRPAGYPALQRLYAAADLHFGNRVHAHLKCLANGAVSFLTPFDLRQKFFSECLDFPLITMRNLGEIVTYDFGRAQRRIDAARPALETFLASVRVCIGAAGASRSAA